MMTVRITPPSLDSMTPQQRQAHDGIANGPRGVVRGPVATWLHTPELAQRAQLLGEYCRYQSSLPPRLSELAILITAQYWQAAYEWNGHVPLARAGGLSDAVIEAVRCNQRPVFEHEDESLVHALATELLWMREVSECTWQHAHLVLGTQGVVDLVGVLGYYGLISMTIKTFCLPNGPDPTAAFPFPTAL